MDIFIVLIVVLLYYINICQNLANYTSHVHFITFQLYLNKVDKNNENAKEDIITNTSKIFKACERLHVQLNGKSKFYLFFIF